MIKCIEENNNEKHDNQVVPNLKTIEYRSLVIAFLSSSQMNRSFSIESSCRPHAIGAFLMLPLVLIRKEAVITYKKENTAGYLY